MVEIIEGLPEADYHALDLMSASRLKVLEKGTPRHLTHTLSEERDTESMRIGSAFHCLTLQPHRFDELFAVAPKVDRRTTSGKLAWAAFCENAAGRTVLDADEAERARGMAEAVLADPDAKALLAACPERELTAIGDVRELHGDLPPIKTKMRLDLRGKGITADLKSMAGTASPYACERYALDYGVWLQMALYRRLMAVDHGCIIVFVENTAPYGVAVKTVAKIDLETYDNALDQCIAKYRRWLANPDEGWGRGELRIPGWKAHEMMGEQP